MAVLVLLLVVLASCGDGGGDGGDGAAPTGASPPDGCTATGGFVGTLSVHAPATLVRGETVTWNVTLTNGADAPATLVFPSAQHADVTLVGPDGAEAYRWSDGRAFAPAVRCAELGARASNSFLLTTDSLDVAPGRYTVRAWVLAAGTPSPVERAVVVSPAGAAP